MGDHRGSRHDSPFPTNTLKPCRLLSGRRSCSNETLNVEVDADSKRKRHGRSSLDDSNPFSANYKPSRRSDSFTGALRHVTQAKQPVRKLTNKDPTVGSVARRKIQIQKNPANFKPPVLKAQKITQFLVKKVSKEALQNHERLDRRCSGEENLPPGDLQNSPAKIRTAVAATDRFEVTHSPSKKVDSISGLSPSLNRGEANVWKETTVDLDENDCEKLISPSIVTATPPIGRRRKRHKSKRAVSQRSPSKTLHCVAAAQVLESSPSFIISPCVYDKRKRRSRHLSEKLKCASAPKRKKAARIGIPTNALEKSDQTSPSVSPGANRLARTVRTRFLPNNSRSDCLTSPKTGQIAARISGKSPSRADSPGTISQDTHPSPCIASTPPKKRKCTYPLGIDMRIHRRESKDISEAKSLLNCSEMSPAIDRAMPARISRSDTGRSATPLKIGLAALFSCEISPAVTDKTFPQGTYIVGRSPSRNDLSISKSPLILQEKSPSPRVSIARRSSSDPYKRVPRRKLQLDDESSGPTGSSEVGPRRSAPSEESTTPDICVQSSPKAVAFNSAFQDPSQRIGNDLLSSPVIVQHTSSLRESESFLGHMEDSPPITTKMAPRHTQSVLSSFLNSATKRLFAQTDDTSELMKETNGPIESQECIPSTVVSKMAFKSGKLKNVKRQRSKTKNSDRKKVNAALEENTSSSNNENCRKVSEEPNSPPILQPGVIVEELLNQSPVRPEHNFLDDYLCSPPICLQPIQRGNVAAVLSPERLEVNELRGCVEPITPSHAVSKRILDDFLPSPLVCAPQSSVRNTKAVVSNVCDEPRCLVNEDLMNMTLSPLVKTPPKSIEGRKMRCLSFLDDPPSPPVLAPPGRDFCTPVISMLPQPFKPPPKNVQDLLDGCPSSPSILPSPEIKKGSIQVNKVTFEKPSPLKDNFGSEILVNTDAIFKKKLLKSIAKTAETQAIDEFNTETLHLVTQATKAEGWSSEGKISEIMSDERFRRSKSQDDTPRTVIEALAVAQKKKHGVKPSLLTEVQEARKGFMSERRAREYERQKSDATGGKEFRVVDIWGKVPLRVSAITEEGPAILVISKGLLKTANSLYPGCCLTIFPPWDVSDGCSGEPPIFSSIRTCEVTLGKAAAEQPAAEAADKWHEVDVQPYRDTHSLISHLLST